METLLIGSDETVERDSAENNGEGLLELGL